MANIEKDNWVILRCSVESFIGRIVSENDSGITLFPAFTWNAGIQPYNNSLVFVTQILPFQKSVKCSKIKIKEYVGIQRLDDWEERDREEIFNKIEDQIDMLNAANANIITPPKNKIQL